MRGTSETDWQWCEEPRNSTRKVSNPWRSPVICLQKAAFMFWFNDPVIKYLCKTNVINFISVPPRLTDQHPVQNLTGTNPQTTSAETQRIWMLVILVPSILMKPVLLLWRWTLTGSFCGFVVGSASGVNNNCKTAATQIMGNYHLYDLWIKSVCFCHLQAQIVLVSVCSSPLRPVSWGEENVDDSRTLYIYIIIYVYIYYRLYLSKKFLFQTWCVMCSDFPVG